MPDPTSDIERIRGGDFQVTYAGPHELFLITQYIPSGDESGSATDDPGVIVNDLVFDHAIFESARTHIANDAMLGGDEANAWEIHTRLDLTSARKNHTDRGFFSDDEVTQISEKLIALGYRIERRKKEGIGNMVYVQEGDHWFSIGFHETYDDYTRREQDEADRLMSTDESYAAARSDRITLGQFANNFIWIGTTTPEIMDDDDMPDDFVPAVDEAEFTKRLAAYCKVYKDVVKTISATENVIAPNTTVVLATENYQQKQELLKKRPFLEAFLNGADIKDIAELGMPMWEKIRDYFGLEVFETYLNGEYISAFTHSAIPEGAGYDDTIISVMLLLTMGYELGSRREIEPFLKDILAKLESANYIPTAQYNTEGKRLVKTFILDLLLRGGLLRQKIDPITGDEESAAQSEDLSLFKNFFEELDLGDWNGKSDTDNTN